MIKIKKICCGVHRCNHNYKDECDLEHIELFVDENGFVKCHSVG